MCVPSPSNNISNLYFIESQVRVHIDTNQRQTKSDVIENENLVVVEGKIFLKQTLLLFTFK